MLLDSWKKRTKLRREILNGNIRKVKGRHLFTLHKRYIEMELGMVVGEEKLNLILNYHSTWKKEKKAKGWTLVWEGCLNMKSCKWIYLSTLCEVLKVGFYLSNSWISSNSMIIVLEVKKFLEIL